MEPAGRVFTGINKQILVSRTSARETWLNITGKWRGRLHVQKEAMMRMKN